jgi:hypothetical protein
MERRTLFTLALFALLIFTPAAVSLAAPPAAQPCSIQVTDEEGIHEFSTAQALTFLHRDYTDVSAVKDPLGYAHDLCLRGKLLAYFLTHSAELTRGGFFEARDESVRQAVRSSVNPDFVNRELAAVLTPKDILALHAVVYATAGPAVHDEFMTCKVAGAALEGKDYAYLAQLRHYALLAADEIRRVRALSGMYGEIKEAAFSPACSPQATNSQAGCAATCPSGPAEKKDAHQCSGACKTEGGKCSGTCSSHQGEEKSGHQCSGACKTEGGKCSGTCSSHQGEEKSDKCAGACKTEGGKCSGSCSGKCKEASGQGASLILPVN